MLVRWSKLKSVNHNPIHQNDESDTRAQRLSVSSLTFTNSIITRFNSTISFDHWLNFWRTKSWVSALHRLHSSICARHTVLQATLSWIFCFHVLQARRCRLRTTNSGFSWTAFPIYSATSSTNSTSTRSTSRFSSVFHRISRPQSSWGSWKFSSISSEFKASRQVRIVWSFYYGTGIGFVAVFQRCLGLFLQRKCGNV